MTGSNEPKADSKGAARLIKRYANRKLYDTRESRYVTLQQIAEYVREGQDVRIIDNTTKEDLTHVTLAQIIVEEEKRAESGPPRASVGTLRSFIQHGRERLITSLREGPVGKLVPRRDPSEPKDDSKSMKSRDIAEMSDEKLREVLAAAVGHIEHLEAHVESLDVRIAALEARLHKDE